MSIQIDEFSCDIRTLTRQCCTQIEVKPNHNNNDEKIEIN